MLQIRAYVLPRRNVDGNIVPFLGRDLGQPPFHQGFAGRDDLDDSGVTRFQIALDRSDQCRGFHGGQEVAEEALLGALESRAGGGLRLTVQRALAPGDIGHFHRRVEIVVNDGLSRGSGNAEERGVVLQSCGTFRHVLHIIL